MSICQLYEGVYTGESYHASLDCRQPGHRHYYPLSHTQTHTHTARVSLSVMVSFSGATGTSTVTVLSVPGARGPK